MRSLVVHLLFVHADRRILLLPPHRLDSTVMQLLQGVHNGLVSTCCHGLHMLTFIIPDVDKDIIQCTAEARNKSIRLQFVGGQCSYTFDHFTLVISTLAAVV